jgi:PAS domain S-box-containing protein
MNTKSSHEELERRVQALETKNTQLEKNLHEARSLSEEVMTYMSEGLVVTDTSASIMFINKSLSEMLGYLPEEIIGKDWLDLVPADQQSIAKEAEVKRSQGYTDRYEIVLHRKNGDKFPVLIGAGPRFDEQSGQYIGSLGVVTDITDRKRAEEALRESEQRYRTILDEMSEGYHEVDLAGNFTFFNEAFLNLFGYSRDEMLGTNFSRYAAEESIVKKVYQTYNEIYQTGNPVRRAELDIIRKGGQKRTLEYSAAVVRDSENAPKGFRGIVRDITERKQAEAEREKLHAQLNQARKMESVGRLAGGVAHDFNNMLGVILGHTELALLRTDDKHKLCSDLNEIQTAAKRSADITKQLLAFARKQTISPRQLDLNDTVESMLNMLRRLIGEDIDLVWQPSPHLWPVKMDPTQIDQILANLCINAKDAIDGVGKLTIETGIKTFDEEYCKEHAGFIPGDFVLLAVSDNGCGMDKDTLDNIFEPFFTTKEMDKGTGLGLATIYGIVKQNSGFINVYSEPGQGSTFKIYLPRLVTDEDTDMTVPEKKAAAGGTETILLVEDEPMILDMTTTMLEMLGYTVLAAASPDEAIRLAKDHTGKIHLLMSDVVLPEMNGRDLAAQITALYPGIRLLFMSGYTANVIAHHGVLDDGVAFMQKPFLMADMTEKVREVLDMASDKS